MSFQEQLKETLDAALEVEDWGSVDYEVALEKQLEYVDGVKNQKIPETIIVCTHPAVVTKGRRTEDSDIFGWDGKVVEVQRGGKATYHGPNQIVVYPIVDLKKHGNRVVGFVRALEKAIMETLSSFEIASESREGAENTGVWVGERKIASIGVAVKKWVTYHGLAINFENDPSAFKGINPCGFSSNVMTSVQEVAGFEITRAEFQSTLIYHLQKSLREI